MLLTGLFLFLAAAAAAAEAAWTPCEAPPPSAGVPANATALALLVTVTRHGARTPLTVMPHEDVTWTCALQDCDSVCDAAGGSGLFVQKYIHPNSPLQSLAATLPGDCTTGQLTLAGGDQCLRLGKSLRSQYVTQVLLLLYIVFCSYPSVARSRRALAVCAAMVAPLVVFYTAEWAMFEDKQSYFDGTRTPGQRWVMLVWDGPGAWLAFLGIWQFARWHWNGVLRAAGHSPRKAKLTQGLVVHVLTYFLHAVLAAGVVLAAWQVVSFMVGRALVLVVIVPAIGVLIYSATRKHEDTWDGGFAVILATAQFSVIALANLLPFVMTIGGTEGVVWAAVKFFAFYIVYGALFSCFQIAVSRMTQSFYAPQFLYILQVFLDAFVGLAFVELRTTAQFWTLLVLQSTWGLVRNTGLFAACFLYTKDAIARMRTGVAPKHTAEFLLQWDQFYFLANAQSILSDIMSSILVPILFVIDYNLPFGACSVSCVFTRSTLVHFVGRFAILLAFRLVMSLVVVASYCVRYLVMVHGRSGGMSLSSILATAKSLCVAFHLHVWRNIALLVAATIYLYSYMLYPVISFHGFGDASSTSASSSP